MAGKEDRQIITVNEFLSKYDPKVKNICFQLREIVFLPGRCEFLPENGFIENPWNKTIPALVSSNSNSISIRD